MFRDSKVFASFSVDNLDRAREFYGQTLGIDIKDNPMGIIELHFGETRVMIYPKTDHKPAAYTVLNFLVDNINETATELAKKGITPEQYDMGGDFKTGEHGIMKNPDGSAIIWFKDPAGNILSAIQEK